MEDNQDNAVAQDQDVTPAEPQKTEPTVAELMAKMESDSQTFKKEIAGLNRRNSELEKIAEEQKKAAMDEQEKILYELEQEKAALTNSKAEFNRMQNKEKALKFATENDVPLTLLDTMDFSSWDTVESNLNTIKAVVDGERERIIEKFKTDSGHAPAAGGAKAPGMVGISTLSGKSPGEINALIKDGRVDFKR